MAAAAAEEEEELSLEIWLSPAIGREGFMALEEEMGGGLGGFWFDAMGERRREKKESEENMVVWT